jgi:hypothetical protein
MTKRRYNSSQQHFQDPMEIERALVAKISETGREELRKRRRAGLSSFYAKEGKIIELLPNNSERVHHDVKSQWIVLTREQRLTTLK